MKLLQILILLINTSCAYYKIIGASEREEKKLRGPLTYEFIDTMGSFIKKRNKGFDKSKNLVVKSEITSSSDENLSVERLVSISGTKNMIKGVNLLLPKKSEVIYWFDGKRYVSSISLSGNSQKYVAVSRSADAQWNRKKSFKVSLNEKAYCFFSQIVECVHRSGFFKKSRSFKSGSMKLEVIWDGYPFFNEQYLNDKTGLIAKGKFSYVSREASGIHKYALDVDGQVVHYFIYRDKHLVKMFWVSQGISQTLVE